LLKGWRPLPIFAVQGSLCTCCEKVVVGEVHFPSQTSFFFFRSKCCCSLFEKPVFCRAIFGSTLLVMFHFLLFFSFLLCRCGASIARRGFSVPIGIASDFCQALKERAILLAVDNSLGLLCVLGQQQQQQQQRRRRQQQQEEREGGSVWSSAGIPRRHCGCDVPTGQPEQLGRFVWVGRKKSALKLAKLNPLAAWRLWRHSGRAGALKKMGNTLPGQAGWRTAHPTVQKVTPPCGWCRRRGKATWCLTADGQRPTVGLEALFISKYFLFFFSVFPLYSLFYET